MNALFRVLSKDMHELITGIKGLALFIVPLIILALAGQLIDSQSRLGVLIKSSTDCVIEERDSIPSCRLRYLLEETANANVINLANPGDPLEILSDSRIDIVVDFTSEEPRNFEIYIDESTPMLIRRYLRFADGIRLVMSIEFEVGADLSWQELLTYQLSLLDGYPFRSAFLYYPTAANLEYALLPMVLAALLCILPFVMAAQLVLRERMSGTLQVLLSAPGIGPAAIFTSKCLVPVIYTILEVILMLLLLDSLFGIYLKPDLVQLFILLTPAIVISSLLGMIVALIISSQTQAVVVTGLYMLSMIFFTGFISPLGEASQLIQAISKLFPLTFVLEPINSWLFGAPIASFLRSSVTTLGLQLLVYFFLANLVWRRFLVRI